jgi:hypothetical protein
MYAGELQYFVNTYCAETSDPSTRAWSVPLVARAVQHEWIAPRDVRGVALTHWLLARYIHVVRNVLPDSQKEKWNTTTAEKLLKLQ